MRRNLILWLGILGLCFGVGCFKSSTLQASSESSSDSSKSSSGSSSPSDEKATAYQRDVRDYTASFAETPGDIRSFQRDLGDIAEIHGMTDWENDAGTFFAVGLGLAEAGVDRKQYEELAIEISNQDFDRLALVQSGYQAGHRVRAQP